MNQARMRRREAAMLTRMDFKALAEALARSKPSPKGPVHQWHLDVDAVSDMCKASNPAFDRARFLKACGEDA